VKKACLFLALSIALLLSACGKEETLPSKETEAVSIEPVQPISIPERNFDTQKVEEFLQGTWTYFDTTLGSKEEYCFDRGSIELMYVLDIAPDNPHCSEGSYEIFDGYIELYFPKTDYTNTMSYDWLGNELVLYWYVDTGADAGNTRVYQKQDTQTPGQTTEKPDSILKENQSIPTTNIVEKPATQNVTSGMRNALRSAESYLSVMPFSRDGLIEQLEYEGYTYSESVYAVDNCGASWKEQAAKSAQAYLDIMPFSRSELIDQLEFEGFTHDQAVYGVNKVY